MKHINMNKPHYYNNKLNKTTHCYMETFTENL